MDHNSFMLQKKTACIKADSLYKVLAAIVPTVTRVTARIAARVTTGFAAAVVVTAENIAVTANQHKNNNYDKPNPVIASVVITTSEKSHK